MGSFLLPLAMCSFPTSFETLWKVAAACGVALLITTVIIFWQKRSLNRLNRPSSTFLMGVTLIGSIWSFALAIATSRNYLICAGIPGASADLMQSADKSYHTLLTFQSVVEGTFALTVIIVLISASSLYFTYRRNLR